MFLGCTEKGPLGTNGLNGNLALALTHASTVVHLI